MLKPSNKTALIQGKKRVTYAKLLDYGLSFGGRLRKEGIGAGSHVLVFVPLSIELYIAMIGVWSVGAAAIFIDYSQGSKFVSDSITRVKADIIVCDGITGIIRNMYPKMRKIKMMKVNLPYSFTSVNLEMRTACDQTTALKLTPIEHDTQLHHPAILTLTSGTTGVPKTSVRTHGFLINQYNVLRQHINFDESHIDLGTLPVFTLANLAAGITTLLPDKSYRSKINPKKLAEKINNEGVTRAICSPALMANLLKHSNLPTLTHTYLGGGPVYPSLLTKMRSDIDLHIVYGSTEAEPISSIRWVDVTAEDKQKITEGKGLPVGKIVPQVECMISENNEILVTGETVLKSYLDGIGDSENKVHIDGKVWHRTGDAGYFDSHKQLWLLGRVSQAIHDEIGTLYPFSVECILDYYYGIRAAVLLRYGARVVVIEEGAANPDDVICFLKSLHILHVIEVKKIPMDKRHGAKIDYEKLVTIL